MDQKHKFDIKKVYLCVDVLTYGFLDDFLCLYDLLDEFQGEYVNVSSAKKIIWTCNLKIQLK